MITSKFKIKSTVPYDIILSEMGAAPIEALAMVRLLSYLKRIEKMEEDRWPKVVFRDTLCKRKRTWMQQNIKWMSKWNIHFNMCPTNNKEIKILVMEKFYKRNWGSEIGRKKLYYINEFNPTCDQLEKKYIGANISWRAKILIAQLRTNSHQLRCETGRWKRPKEAWEERICRFCNSGKVETEQHFILECEAYKDSRDKFADTICDSSWHNLFNEDYIEQLGGLIITFYNDA